MYGFDCDNFIGTTPQTNSWHKHWHVFFAEQRTGYQLQLLTEHHAMLGNIDELVARITVLLKSHQPTASLLHGDLWRGNLSFCQNKPVIFDPASYYGDFEADLAMTELFGKFPQSFYDGYHEVQPVSSHYKFRKEIYNLYHLLNHANLFGGIYVTQAKHQIAKILSF